MKITRKTLTIHGKDYHLFPLTALQGFENRFEGYFIDKNGDLWSTRVSAEGRRMYGTRTHVTLNKATYSKAWLLAQARRHPLFTAITSGQDARDVAVEGKVGSAPKTSDRDHAKTVAEGIKARGYVIGRVNGFQGVEFLLFGSKPAIHTTLRSAKSEVERLAIANPGVQFVYLKIEGAAKSGGLSWE